MSSTRCDVLNWLLVPLSAAELLILTTDWGRSHEFQILCILTLVATSAHVHFGVCVVRQMCLHFGINCFSLKKREDSAAQDVRQKLLDRQQCD